MPTVAAAKAMRAARVSPPKLTIALIVSATAVEIKLIATRPTKLQITLIKIAALTLIERVPIGSAIAFAASVAPFTKIVPRTRTTTMAKKGLAASKPRNCSKLITKAGTFLLVFVTECYKLHVTNLLPHIFTELRRKAPTIHRLAQK